MAHARRGRLGLALLVAPLAGPSAAWVVALFHGVLTPRPPGEPPWSFAAALVLLFAFCLFGAPPAYVATICLAWPLTRALGRWSRPWWPLTLACAVAGAAVLPFYLKMLTPRGSWNLGPGIGFIAGAASGCVFWYLATGARGDADEHVSVERQEASTRNPGP